MVARLIEAGHDVAVLGRSAEKRLPSLNWAPTQSPTRLR